MDKNSKLDIARMRNNYLSTEFNESNVKLNPIEQFKVWFNETINLKIEEPNAMTLATASIDGYPNARFVLLKEFDTRGFVFYTNYGSNKGKELELNRCAVLVFYWKELTRQVRIKGKVEKVSREESEKYFHSRPRESQLSAWASKQSKKISNRKILEHKFQSLLKKFYGKEIPLPSYWGGYRVIPFEIEFWQGRENRLHDRIIYRLKENGWNISRLSP